MGAYFFLFWGMSIYQQTLLLSLILCLCFRPAYAQNANPRIMYVVDSIPIMKDPDPADSLPPYAIAEIHVIKNKDTLALLGYSQFDGVAFIFTKAYQARPDSLKAIPSTSQLKKKNEAIYFHDYPYTGPFIDYYLIGRKRTEGRLRNGLRDGLERKYYPDGRLMEEGAWAAGKEEGIWKSYFPNGRLSLQSAYLHGELTDSAFRFYSTGMVKARVFFRNGKAISDARQSKIDDLMAKSRKSYQEEDPAGALKYTDKAIAIDSNCADAWFSRGTLKLNDFKFDEAITDFDKTLTIEPLMATALTNRAFARIRKYQFTASRTLSQSRDVTVMASKDKVDIPPAEKEIICADLNKAIWLGERKSMITEALKSYCQ
jgi:tetratricopeptide (TPR) repeat protein